MCGAGLELAMRGKADESTYVNALDSFDLTRGMVVVMVVMVAASCASDRRGSGLHAADTRGAADKRGAAVRRCPPFRNVAMLPTALRIIALAWMHVLTHARKDGVFWWCVMPDWERRAI